MKFFSVFHTSCSGFYQAAHFFPLLAFFCHDTGTKADNFSQLSIVLFLWIDPSDRLSAIAKYVTSVFMECAVATLLSEKSKHCLLLYTFCLSN